MPDHFRPLRVKKDQFSSHLKPLIDAIKKPAYIIKEGRVAEGKIILWNKELENLTNFKESDIRNKHCYDIFKGMQRRIYQNKPRFIPVCDENCKLKRIKSKTNPWYIKDFWIRSKNKGGGIVMHNVDVYIIPLKMRNSKLAIHILFDKEATLTLSQILVGRVD